MTEKVTDFPDVGWVRKLPEWVTSVRISLEHRRIYLVAEFEHNGDLQVLHVDMPLQEAYMNENCWRPAVNNLGGAIFELEYPKMFGELIRKEVEAVLGKYTLTKDEAKAIQRRKELSV